jgi:RNA polymerase sigma factor (sigma-70 family)
MTDEELIRHLNSDGRQQRRALTYLYQSKAQDFGRYFRRSGLNHADAEDAVQDAILKVFKSSQKYSGEGTLNSWMWAIARNVLIDRKRAEKRSLEDTLNDVEWSSKGIKIEEESDNGLISADIEMCVSKGIKKFARDDPERAYAISLHVEGVEGREVAERIGRTYEATRQYLLQSRQKLAPYISNCLELITT